jgi:hypothetical protein
LYILRNKFKLPKNIKATANTVNWGNLFVTVFAKPYLDRIAKLLNNFIIYNLSSYTAIAPKTAAHDGANTAPYRLATGTLSLLTTGTSGRMASPVTQTAPIAVPLWLIARHPAH